MGPVGEARASECRMASAQLILGPRLPRTQAGRASSKEVCPRRREESAAASSTLDEITQGHLGLLLSNRPKHVMVMGIKSGSSKSKDSKASVAIEEGERPFEILGPDGKPARANSVQVEEATSFDSPTGKAIASVLQRS